ncbi:GNAT family N-acetyltransferase [Microbacterium sp. cf046]|uniref:GNAT family N-acetyltransferase n=1 Tax=Microbacterium sp. cf046 TaxID=1761803 RepID=UPI000B84F03F|nr:GNAT family N-acetyltransferase [Microbacterium sp. cf046]
MAVVRVNGPSRATISIRAAQTARAIVEWATDAGCPRLWAQVWDWNVSSRRVLAKLGFRELRPIGPGSTHGRSLLTVRDAR